MPKRGVKPFRWVGDTGWHHHPFITPKPTGRGINFPAIKAINHTKWAINHFSVNGFGNDEKYLAWVKKMKAQNRQHSKTVPLPDYNGQDVCGITVHFLPCDDVKVTTSCWSPRNANYPIKEPVRMKEPAVCPK